MPKRPPPKLPSSAGQKKCALLNLKLPLLPTTAVGSFPKSVELIELKKKVLQGFVDSSELERKEKIATEICLREQTRVGLNVAVDGEMNRSDLISFFARRIDGFEPGGTVRSYGNRYTKKPIIKQKLTWKGPMSVAMWQFSQRATHDPVKAIVTGPYTLMDWSFNEYYSSREAACDDLTVIIKKEIQALSDAGAKIIQIDEPALSARPSEFSMVANALKDITKGIKAYFVLHFCYGDIHPLWSKIRELPVDNFSLEAANSNFSILPLLKKAPTTKDLTIGIIDSHNHTVETPRQLNANLRAILKVVPANQLWLSPDCGLKTRTSEEAYAKLEALVKTVKKIRPTLSR